LFQVLNTFFVGEAIPDTVTSQNDEFISRLASILGKVWVGSDSLLLGIKIWLVFVLEISESSAQGKVSINSGIFDVMIGFLNSLELISVVWLMIETELNSLTVSTEDSSAIASVGAIYVGIGNEYDTGSGASVVSIVFLLTDFFVQLEESFFKGELVLFVFKLILAFKNPPKLESCVLCYFFSSMAVKHTK